MTIDSHHHFWRYDPVQYDWIDESMRVLRRDFLPEHLRAALAEAKVDGVVSVQARQSMEETRWLLSLAREHDFIRGVVGWVPLVSDRVRDDLERFAPHPKLKAVRHVLQDEPDDRYALRDDFNRGVALLKDFGLVYDVLIYERQLPPATEFVDRHPGQRFVLDHIAKPRVREGVLSPWRENLRALAKRENVYCKLSGVATEADWANWTPEDLRPYVEVALDAFGPRRLMFGSDWPVCLVACGYGQWHRLVTEFISRLPPDEQRRVMGETAADAYGL